MPRRKLMLRDFALSLLTVFVLFACTAPARADREACIAAHEEAQLMRLRGHYSTAREQLLLCAQNACPTLIRSDCIAQLSEVDASLPSIVLAVLDGEGHDLVDVRVKANGKLLSEHLDGRAVALDPGVYELHFEAAGFLVATQKITVLEAEKRRLIRVQLLKEAASLQREGPSAGARTERRYIASYALWGGGLAALGTGIALGALGKNTLDRLERSCAREACGAHSVAHVKRLYIGADVAFGLSGGLTLAATWLFFATRKSAKTSDESSLANLRTAFSAQRVLVAWSRPF